jgi:hypothetical protein
MAPLLLIASLCIVAGRNLAPLLSIASSPSPLRGWVVPPLHRRRRGS